MLVAGKNLDWYLGHKYAHNAYNVHADRGRPTLKDDDRFQNGLVRDLKIRILNKCWQELSIEFESVQIPNFTMIYFIESKIYASTSG